jgi:hypothetical protein
VTLALAAFAAVGLATGLFGFTGTFDVAIMGGCFGCGRAVFFGAAAT